MKIFTFFLYTMNEVTTTSLDNTETPTNTTTTVTTDYWGLPMWGWLAIVLLVAILVAVISRRNMTTDRVVTTHRNTPDRLD